MHASAHIRHDRICYFVLGLQVEMPRPAQESWGALAEGVFHGRHGADPVDAVPRRCRIEFVLGLLLLLLLAALVRDKFRLTETCCPFFLLFFNYAPSKDIQKPNLSRLRMETLGKLEGWDDGKQVTCRQF